MRARGCRMSARERQAVFLDFPDDWEELSEAEKMAVARGMARELQRQWGITPAMENSSEEDK